MGDVGCSVFGILPKAIKDQEILTSAFIISGHYLFNMPLVTPQSTILKCLNDYLT